MISENSYDIIDTFIEQGKSFAIWRLPGKESYHFVMQSAGSPRLLHDIRDLDGRRGFVIAPFHVTNKRPIALIEPDLFGLPSECLTCSRRAVSNMRPNKIEPLSSEEEEMKRYSNHFARFIDPLQKGDLDKLVLSRGKTISREHSFSPGRAFFAAAKRYVRSYTYLCHTPETGTWMGGTPEILLSGENRQWHTVALAGTQPLHNGNLPTSWNPKNLKEQQLVALYIQRQLSSLGIDSTEEGPYTTRAGEVSHLKSDFFFSLHDTNKLGDLLQMLHPTPAVCGLPKEEAYQFILKNEGYERNYYSGFIGWLDPNGKTDLYVNLRCMSIQEEDLTLYAGGGLLAASRMEEEWQETEFKLDTMRRLLL